MNILKTECPYCAGESGTKDYFGEWSECECCNPNGDNETGRLWRWKLWLYRYRLWRWDRWAMREMRRDEQIGR